MADKKPMGYWKDWWNAARELKAYEERLERFPKSSELTPGFLSVLKVHFGGYLASRERYELTKNEIPKVDENVTLDSILRLEDTSTDLGYSPREYLETYEGGNRD